jgi:copper oxidase (laccase) domain-containing protein
MVRLEDDESMVAVAVAVTAEVTFGNNTDAISGDEEKFLFLPLTTDDANFVVVFILLPVIIIGDRAKIMATAHVGWCLALLRNDERSTVELMADG